MKAPQSPAKARMARVVGVSNDWCITILRICHQVEEGADGGQWLRVFPRFFGGAGFLLTRATYLKETSKVLQLL